MGSSGYDKKGWRDLTATMVDLSASPDTQEAMADYLAANFPPNDTRTPKIVSGETEISFADWVVPTPGQRPRDPVEAADGSIWWAGQRGNIIGRIDPKSGEMTEYPMPAGAHPHTVTPDAEGRILYTGNKNGTVGVLAPKTGEITEYKMPDEKTRAIRTRRSSMVTAFCGSPCSTAAWWGSLDPNRGDIKLVSVPTPNSRPYGIRIDADGVPWVACNGGPCLLRVDPKTMDLSEVKLPTQGTTVRRLDIASDGSIWYVNSGKGRLGHYDPKTGEIKEWDSPSGPLSHPYAIAVIDDIVWYNESGKRSDTLVRFDPKSETFQSWAIPSGDVYAGIVRHMRPTADGNLLIHQGGTNRVMRVDIQP